MTESSVRGAGTARAGATDTTMLIWKVIAANPGITRAEIWERVEHSIPEGYAIRRYTRYRAVSGSKSRLTGNPVSLLFMARGYLLNLTLKNLRRDAVTCEGDGNERRYTVRREIGRYYGNSEVVDETGIKAAEHMAVAEALRTVDKLLARASPGPPWHGQKMSKKEHEAVQILVKTLRAQGSAGA